MRKKDKFYPSNDVPCQARENSSKPFLPFLYGAFLKLKYPSPKNNNKNKIEK